MARPAPYGLVVIAGSAGAIGPLRDILAVQEEATAEHFDMPRAAIASGAVDRVWPVERIGPFLAELGRRPTPYWKEPA